jgi:regulatory protein
VQRSLKARALQWLAQREQSPSELRRKLLPHAHAQAAAALAKATQKTTPTEPVENPALQHGPEAANTLGEQVCDVSAATPAARVEAVLDWLQAHQYLNEERFVESRVNARADRFGNLRIRQELQQHQLKLSPEAAQTLAETELQRACAVRERKFPQNPTNTIERAKQARFLAGRGFSSDAIQNALRHAARSSHESDDEEETS